MYAHADALHAQSQSSLIDRLNGRYHEIGLRVFMVIVLAHWGEHLFQAFQIYVLGWPVPKALGLLGLFYPWLIKSEVLHYAYALVMLIGLWIFRPGFTGVKDRRWWTIALWIQFWHHIEHLLLIVQATIGHNLLGRPVPTSVLQIWLPRVELHLFYNAIVFVPMVIGMYYHLFPPAEEHRTFQCSCAWDAEKRGIAA
ncbi:MAG TPA: hypothetical protein VN628_03355 [Vicinamibacterales bacterium]|nr:hypothetical protein [Vicinamibacterales bacterium]